MTAVFIVLLHGRTFALFETAGTIADQEKGLIIFTVLLGFAVVIPVLVLVFAVAWHYREGNTKAKYTPEVGGNRIAETIWWLIPTVIIGVLGVVIWRSTHDLDPYKALVSDTKAINVQVVALDWRWLFIYPDEKVASLSYLKFPVNTPVNFTITADAPMNSFWIPRLSGQVYAMSGMSTQLHIAASETGDFTGSSANLSGRGFAGMKFTASSVSKSQYDGWVKSLQSSPKLDAKTYATLAADSTDTRPYSYALSDKNLYTEIIEKYMDPGMVSTGSTSTDRMKMEGM